MGTRKKPNETMMTAVTIITGTIVLTGMMLITGMEGLQRNVDAIFATPYLPEIILVVTIAGSLFSLYASFFPTPLNKEPWKMPWHRRALGDVVIAVMFVFLNLLAHGNAWAISGVFLGVPVFLVYDSYYPMPEEDPTS
jgi:hypothetical protein